MICGKRIFVNMIIDSRPEKFLLPCLKSISDVADEIIIVANPNNANAEIINSYPKTRVAYQPFEDFSVQRNRCLELSKQADYILWVDSDEVHFKNDLYCFVKDTVEGNYGHGVAAFYHFVKSFKTYQSIDGRQILFKNHPDIRWVGKVDETLNAFPEPQLLTSYKYHHYGYTKPQCVVHEGWVQRAGILQTNEWYLDRDPETILDERPLTNYKGEYPKEMDEILHLEGVK